jgi:superfamily II DNA/RNA helicase
VEEKVIPYITKHTFADFKIEERLKGNIKAKGYVTPTPIQDQAIPEILAGNDIVGIANTGTGKTAAFLIPLIHKVMIGHNEQVLIIAPTRELAQQINEEFKAFRGDMRMYSVCLVGGAPIGSQMRDLRYFNSFVIGTPGRIKDLVDRKCLDLSKFNTIVLDEADRMLDMGFVNDMRFVVSKMPRDRHTLFFSATISPEVEKLIKDFLNDPVRVTLKTGDTSKNVLQDVVRVRQGQNKMDVLHELLQDKAFEKVIVFGRTKHGVQNLSDALNKRGYLSTAIHGNKNQGQRQRALADFKNHKSKILVATDVAARGLDIPNVSHVINFDIPATHEDYIHRIGRTGRGENKGKALTFVD